jgi:hypothetical protein
MWTCNVFLAGNTRVVARGSTEVNCKTIPSHSLWARSGPTQTHIDTQLHRRFSSVPYGTTFVCPSLLCIALRVCVCALCVCVCVCVCVPGGGLQWRPRSSRYMLLPCVVPVPCVYVCVCVCVCLISTCFCPVDTTRAKKRRTKVNFNHPLHLSACYLVEVCVYVCCRGVVWGMCVWGGGLTVLKYKCSSL